MDYRINQARIEIESRGGIPFESSWEAWDGFFIHFTYGRYYQQEGLFIGNLPLPPSWADATVAGVKLPSSWWGY